VFLDLAHKELLGVHRHACCIQRASSAQAPSLTPTCLQHPDQVFLGQADQELLGVISEGAGTRELWLNT
jgi:hypothetical protein